MKNNSHSRFRTTVAWKKFRMVFVPLHNSRCDCCGVHKKGLQIHHLFPDDYENLDPARFALLCSDCHSMVEKLAKRLNGKKAHTILNLPQWLALYGPFLPQHSPNDTLPLSSSDSSTPS